MGSIRITIEGTTGTGKTSIGRLLVGTLREIGLNVLFVDEDANTIENERHSVNRILRELKPDVSIIEKNFTDTEWKARNNGMV